MSADQGFGRAERTDPRRKTARRRGFSHDARLVFELTPAELRILVEREARALDEEIEATLLPNVLEHDSEVGTGDDDAPPLEDDDDVETNPVDPWVSPSRARPLPSDPEPATILETSRFYCLTTFPAGDGGGMRCIYEAPNWMSRRDSGLGGQLYRLIAFLQATAQWLENECQPFLHDPRPCRYAEAQRDYSAEPVVTQKGFAKQVKALLPEPLRIGEAGFSRVLPNVWLLWPDASMPLSALFSRAFRKGWVAVGALEGLPAGQWQVDHLAPLDAAGRKALGSRAFDNLSRSERLHLLYDRAGIRRDEALAAARDWQQQLLAESVAAGQAGGGKP
jgi:hypothetical protein